MRRQVHILILSGASPEIGTKRKSTMIEGVISIFIGAFILLLGGMFIMFMASIFIFVISCVIGLFGVVLEIIFMLICLPFAGLLVLIDKETIAEKSEESPDTTR